MIAKQPMSYRLSALKTSYRRNYFTKHTKGKEETVWNFTDTGKHSKYKILLHEQYYAKKGSKKNITGHYPRQIDNQINSDTDKKSI